MLVNLARLGVDSLARLTHSVQRADLVPVRIPEVRQVEPTFFPQSGWVLAGCAAVGDARGVPGISRFRAGGEESDGAAVAVAGGLAVDGFGQCEDPLLGPVEAPSLWIYCTRLVAQRAEHGVVKSLRRLDVVCPYRHMAEQVKLLC